MFSLKRLLKKEQKLAVFAPLLEKAWQTKWVVHCEPSLAKAEHVIRYLGQYTHRVAITNQRILDVSNSHVRFMAKDYRDKAIKKPVTMEGTEFLRRFCLHILPKRFVKIRRYGIYNHTIKRNLALQFELIKKPDIIEQADKPVNETPQQRIKRLTGFDVYKCPYCKNGIMHKIRELPKIRSPALRAEKLFASVLS